MKLLLKNTCITDPSSPYNKQVKDIFIENGIISEIGNTLAEANGAKVFDGSGLQVSPGWFDMNVHLCDPGLETKEDILSGIQAAMGGGFTGIACFPDTLPPLHSKSEIAYVFNKSRGQLVDVYPYGALTKNREGRDISEMADMKNSGAVGFTDGNKPVTDAGVMIRALMYAKGFQGLVISQAEDPDISAKGKMNEGVVSTMLGISGIPGLAEEVMVSRDIFLAEYAGARIHFTTVSTARSVELIRKAKKQGLPITADVSAHHLLLDEEALEGFDTHFKVKPPLRTKHDIKALKEGLKDGTIDAVCSQHRPQEVEYKRIEFESAAYGIMALETAFSLLCMGAGTFMSGDLLIQKLAINPRKILGLEVPVIETGKKANLTLFDPEEKWTLQKENVRSRSFNSPFIGTELKGRAKAVFNHNQFHIIS